MRIIDFYLLQQFLKSLLVFLVTFTGLYVVIDAFGNLEELLDYGQTEGGLLLVIREYYGARALALFDRVSGILTLVSAMFTVTALERSNELTALMAAGISKARVCQSLVIAVVVVSGLAVVNREVLLPAMQDKLTRNAQDWLGDRAKTLHPVYDNLTDIHLGGKSTFANEQRIDEPNFGLPPILSEAGSQLVADQAFWHPATEDRPSGYWLQGLTQPRNFEEQPSLQLGEQTVVYSPHDTPWLKPGECFVVSEVDFQQLAGGSQWRLYSSTWQLIGSLHNPSLDVGPDVRVAVHARFVRPLLDVCLLFLGLPLVLSQTNRNLFVSIGWCLLIVAGFFLLVLGCHALGNYYLISPSLAAWFPLMVAVPLAVTLSRPLFE